MYIFLASQTKLTFKVFLNKQRGLNFSQKNKQRLSNDLQDLKILKGLKITALLIKQNKCINFTPFRKDKKTVLQKNKMQTQTPKSTNAREPFSNECWTDKLRTEKFYSV